MWRIFAMRKREEKKGETKESRVRKETRRGCSLRSHPTATGTLAQVARRTGIKKPGVRWRKKWRTKDHDETEITRDYSARVIAIN